MRVDYPKLLLIVIFLLVLSSFASRLVEAKPRFRERVKDKPRVQKIKKKKKPKKRYQRKKKRQPKYQLKRRPKRGFISPEVYKKQQRERRERKLRQKKQKKVIPSRRQKPVAIPKPKKKVKCYRACLYQLRQLERLLRLGNEYQDSYNLYYRNNRGSSKKK